MRISTVIKIDSRRPNYNIDINESSISSISPNIFEIEIDNNQFSIRFEYIPDEYIDPLIEIFMNIWFSYEQPTALFVVDHLESWRSTLFSWRSHWSEVTTRIKSFIFFKAIEDDMWIGKSSALRFEDIIFD